MDGMMVLPRRLDSSAADGLQASLLGLRGSELILDASGVENLGGLALEVLVAAGFQWERDGAKLSVHNPSDAFASVCRTLGLDSVAPWQPDAETHAEPGDREPLETTPGEQADAEGVS